MEKNVERLMKKTKKELVELILRKDEEAKSVGNSLSDAIDKCNNLESRLQAVTRDYENSEKEKENLSNSLSDYVKQCDYLRLELKNATEHSANNESLAEENNRLRKYLQEANQNVLEHQETIDSLTTDKETIKDKLYTVSKKNKRLSNWCGILYIIIIVLVILLLVF